MLTLLIFFLGFIYGLFFHRNHLPPHKISLKVFNYVRTRLLKQQGPYSIGLYTGDDIYNLKNYHDDENPIITANDVTDINAKFVADPFLCVVNKKYFIFYEVMCLDKKKGVVAFSESIDKKKWKYGGVVLDEKFHLSYPYLFEQNGEYFLMPESAEDYSVKLYKSESFPYRWTFVKNIINGSSYIDPSIFHWDDYWWLFVTDANNNVLNLYYSGDIMGNFAPHPMNPIVKFNKKISRSAGRVLIDNGKIFRFAQDCSTKIYGKYVYAIEITTLTLTNYDEVAALNKPILSPNSENWSNYSMHHIDLLRSEKGGFIAAVDGTSKL
jgi:hypothetical protein